MIFDGKNKIAFNSKNRNIFKRHLLLNHCTIQIQNNFTEMFLITPSTKMHKWSNSAKQNRPQRCR